MRPDGLSETDGKARDFVLAYAAREGRGPSIREVGEHLRLTNPNNAKPILDRLVARGHLAADAVGGAPGRPRALRLVLPPRDRPTIPVLGRVACGAGRESLEEMGEHLDLVRMFGRDDLVAYRAEGHSMRDAAIEPGDYLVVRPCDGPEGGDKVVAYLNGSMVCKRYRPLPGGGVRLEPCNVEMLRSGAVAPVEIAPGGGDQFRVCGVLMGVVRRF